MSLKIVVDLVQEYFKITNTGSGDVNLEGYTVEDQGVHDGISTSNRNVYKFNGFTLASGKSVTVYSGTGSSTAREYDDVETIHWGNHNVWNNTGDTAYLKDPAGSLIATSAAENGCVNPDVERPDGTKLSGTCKWFNSRKYFGFIHHVSDGGPEVFIHATGINSDDEVKALVPGQQYEFIWKEDAEKKGQHKGRGQNVSLPGGEKVKTHESQRRSHTLKRLEENPDIKLGNIKWFNPARGYGFIIPFGSGDKDVFVYRRELKMAPGAVTVDKSTPVEYKLKVLDEKSDGGNKTTAVEVTGPGGEPLGVVAMNVGVGAGVGVGVGLGMNGRVAPRVPVGRVGFGVPRPLIPNPRQIRQIPQVIPRRGVPLIRQAVKPQLVHPQVSAAQARTAVLGQRRFQRLPQQPVRQPVQPIRQPPNPYQQAGGYGILQSPAQRQFY